jgi:hypothetical protein
MGAKRGTKVNGPKHSVDLTFSAFDIPKAGSAVKFTIRAVKGAKVGTIEIGQGSFGWKPAWKQRFKRFSWNKLAKILDDHV